MQGGAILTVATVLGQGLGFVENIILANTFSVETYGRIALGLTVVGITGPLLQLGLGTGAKRYVGEYILKEDPYKEYGTVVFAIVISGSLGIFVATVIYVFSGILATAVFDDPGFGQLLAIFSGIIAVSSVLGVLSAIFQGKEQFARSVLVGNLGQSVIRISAAVLAVLAALTAESMVLLVAVGFVLLCFSSVLRLLMELRSQAKHIEIPAKKLLSFSMPLLFSTISSRILSSADYLLLGAIGTVTSVGLYRPAFLLGSSVGILYQALNKAFYPIAISINATNDQSAERLLTPFLFWSFVLTVPVFTWTTIFSSELLKILFKPAYAEGSLTLVIIAFTIFVSVILGPVGTILEIFKKTTLILYSYIAASLLNISLNVLLIPEFGILGAAIGTGISLIVLNLMQLVVARRYIRFEYDLSRMGRALFVAVVLVVPAVILPLADWMLIPLSVPYFVLVLWLTVAIVPIRDADRELFGPITERVTILRRAVDRFQ
jgi:O-antigen/teichoic acid export membrane protein